MNASSNETTVPEGLDPRVRHRDVFVEVDAIHLEKMRHQAQVREFTIVSDEPESLGEPLDLRRHPKRPPRRGQTGGAA